MPYITEQEAAAEVNKWSVEFKDLKPALVTDKDLWKLYKQSNSKYRDHICALGLVAATTALGSAGALNALKFVRDVVQTRAQNYGIDKGLEKGVDRIAAVYFRDYDANDSSFTLAANKAFATNVASGFVTILMSVAGGTLTAVTGGGVAIATALAIMVYIGDLEQAAEEKRWSEIVGSMMERYSEIRQKKIVRLNEKNRAELERGVMSMARIDLEEEGGVKTWTWNSGRSRASYPKKNLEQLRELMVKYDPKLGAELMELDLLDIAQSFRQEAIAFWDEKGPKVPLDKLAPAGKKFDKPTMVAFMRRQIDARQGYAIVPTTESELNLAARVADALKDELTEEELEEGEKNVPKKFLPQGGAGKGAKDSKIQT